MITWLRDLRAALADDRPVALFRYYTSDGRLRTRRVRVTPEEAAELVRHGIDVDPLPFPDAFPWPDEAAMKDWTENVWRSCL